MADFDSSLPVRSENTSDLQVSVYDSTGTNPWNIDANNIGHVTLDDGTNQLVIGANGGITTIVTDGTDTIAIDASGNLSTIITDGTDSLDINSSGTIGIGDGTNDWVFNANGAGKVSIEDDNGDQLGVNSDGSINVNVIDAVQGGEVHEYGVTASVASGASSDVVDYTVTAATTLLLEGWQSTSSGKAKAELKVGPAASEVTQAVRFISTSNGGFMETFPEAIEVAAGDKVLVTVTNNEPGQAVDLYAWINGREVA